MANSSTTPFIAALTLVLTAKGALVVVSFTVRFCKAIVISTNFGLLLFLMVRAKVCFMGSVSTVVNHVLMFPRVPLQVSGGGGKCLQGNLWYSPPAGMTSRLASVTFKMASKVFIEETNKNFDFMTEILFRFLGFGDFKVSIVIEN